MTDLLKILRNFYSKHEDNIDLLLDLLDTFVTIVEIFSPESRFTKKYNTLNWHLNSSIKRSKG